MIFTRNSQLSLKLGMRFRIEQRWFYVKRWWKEEGFDLAARAPLFISICWVIYAVNTGGLS